ncbi:MAG: type II secretion system protein N [Hyphomonas sp.]
MHSSLLSALTQASPALRRAIVLVIALAAGLGLGRVFWLLVEPGGAGARPLAFAAPSGSAGAPADSLRPDLMSLARSNRFGSGAAGAPVIPNAPETRLNLKLKGVRAVPDTARSGDTADTSIAIIQTPDQSALTYRPGDLIIEGVTLERILPDRVLIIKGGALETLMMESSASALSVLSLPGQPPRTAGQPLQGGPASPQGGQAARLLAGVDFEPVQSGASLTGYRIRSRGNEAGLAALGLQAGDGIVEIAGNRVGSAAGQDLFAELGSASQLDLTVERGGTLQSVTLSLPRGN